MKLKILYEDNNFIEIDLIDHFTIKKWFNHFKKINDSQPDLYKNYSYSIEKKDYLHERDNEHITKNWDIIKETLDRLKTTGYKIPFSVPDQFDFNQSTLNLLHRFFTLNAMWFHNKDHQPNSFDPDFYLRYTSWNDWFNFIDQINCAVHQLETFTFETPNRKTVHQRYPLCYLNITPDDNNQHWLNFDEVDYSFNYKYINSEYDECNVFLDESILGKSIFRSFYDNDDPTSIDRTGRKGSFGGFIIDLNQNRKKLYNSIQFSSWLKKFNLDPNYTEYEFPIGKIIKYTQPLVNFGKKDYFCKRVEFLD